jgi:hypothetical protein
MKDCHMQRFLPWERFFVGQDVINFDAMKHVSHGDVEGLSVDKTNNAKEVHLNLVCGEGLQLMFIVVDHGYSDHQTSQGITNNFSLCDTIIPIATRLNFTNVMEFNQFKSNIAPSKLSNPT